MVNAGGEVTEEAHGVEVLPDEMAGVEVEPEPGPVADRLEGALGRPVVVSDLAGVHFVGEAHANLVEDVDNRVPSGGKVVVARFDHLWRYGWEPRQSYPDRRTGEPDDGLDPEPGRGTRGVLHFLGGPLADALGIAITPNSRRQYAAVAFVYRVVAD